MEKLSDRINEAYAQANCSKRALARAVGVSAPSVNQWFSGKTQNIQYQYLVKAADFLEVNPHWLATGEGLMHDGITKKDKVIEEKDISDLFNQKTTTKELNETKAVFISRVNELMDSEDDKELVAKLNKVRQAIDLLLSIFEKIPDNTRKDIANFVYLLLVEQDKKEQKLLIHLITDCLLLYFSGDKKNRLIQSSKHKEVLLNTWNKINQQ